MWDRPGGRKDGILLSNDFELDVNPGPGLELGRTEERGCSKLRRGRRDAYGFDIEDGKLDPSPMD